MRDECGTVVCAVIDKCANELQILNDNDGTRLIYKVRGNTHQCNILEDGFSGTGNHTIWDVVSKFRLFVCCNLTYYFTVMGHDGHSTYKCPYCTLTIAEWKKTRLPKQSTIATHHTITTPTIGKY